MATVATGVFVNGHVNSLYENELSIEGIAPQRPVAWAGHQRKVAKFPLHRQPAGMAANPYGLRHVRGLRAEERPVLVGTRSVSVSEHLSELLSAAGLRHHVLNARQDQAEAEVVARTGGRGRLTVATNMAGPGIDIRLAADVAGIGGLHVLATERHDGRRVDRQLFGRSGRQGDPGSFQAIVSLEDEVVQDVFNGYASRLCRRLWRG